MGILSSFSKTVSKALDQTVGELKPGGKAWNQRKGALGKWDPGKGWLGHATKQIYGGTFKDIMDTMQGKDSDYKDTDVADPVLSAGDMAARARADDVQSKHKEERGRLASVQTKGKKATLLTG